jgi:hypothetical protein
MTMRDCVVSLSQFRSRSRGWSNQELAEFYRVESVLIQAGISLTTEHGLSDEGDPWFAFCREDDGEVIVHIARCDGCYILASAAYGIARGFDISSLVRDLLTQQALIQVGTRKRPEGSNVFLHPAALLIAVVGTAFFKVGEARATESYHDGRDPAHHDGTGSTFGGIGISQFITAISAETGHWTVALSALIGGLLGGEADLDAGHTQPQLPAVPISAVEDASLDAHAPTSSSFPTQIALTHPNDSALTTSDDATDGSETIHSIPLNQDAIRSNQEASKLPWLTSVDVSANTHSDSNSAFTADSSSYSKNSPAPNGDSGGETLQISDLMRSEASLFGSTFTWSAGPNSIADAPTSGSLGPLLAVLDGIVHLGVQIPIDVSASDFIKVDGTALANGFINFAEIGHPIVDAGANSSGPPAPAPGEPSHVPDGAPTPHPASSAVPPPPQIASLEAALQTFMANTPGFGIVETAHEVIFYDRSNLAHASSVTWDFADGSSLSVVGLPANLPHVMA